MRRSRPGSSGVVRGRQLFPPSAPPRLVRCPPHPTQSAAGPSTFRSVRCESPEQARTTIRPSSSTATLSGCRCWRASREATGRTARSSASLIPLRTWRSSGPLSRLSRSTHRFAGLLSARHGGPGASGRQDGHRRPGACFAAPLLAGERRHDLPRSGWAGGRIRVVGLWGGPDLTEHHSCPAPVFVCSIGRGTPGSP
jgi:hypothetical protein